MKLNRYLIMNNISVVMVVKGYSEYVFKTLESVRSLASEILIGDIGIDEELLAKLKKIENIKIVTVTKKVPYVELIREELHAQAKGCLLYTSRCV